MTERLDTVPVSMHVPKITGSPPVWHVRHSDVRRDEHRYIFDVLLGEHLGLEFEAEAVPGLPWIELQCPGAAPGRVLKIGSNLLLRPKDKWVTAENLPAAPIPTWNCQALLPDWDLGPVPVLFPAITQAGGLFLPVDIFGGAFFLLTRYEELVSKARDRHKRFAASESVAFKAGLLGRPMVDEYSRLLGQVLAAGFPGFKPRTHPSRIQLTHDVDHPYQFFGKTVPQMAYAAGKWLYHHPSPAQALGLARAGAHSGFAGDISRDPFNSYANLMKAGERLGIPCEFYLMAGHRRGRYEESYDLNQPALQGLMREINARGHVIGLHASYDSFGSPEMLIRERDYLAASAKRVGIKLNDIGGRQHYLRWENPRTWRSWEKAGLAYDATVGFADQVGFRCGTSHEFPVFDVLASKRLSLRERPLIVMDVTMTDYMKLPPEEIIGELRRLWQTVKSLGGTFEVLVHNCNPQASWLAEQLSRF
jgi:hypothetical protein